MASGTGFLLVLSSFSLKYISLSTDWIAGPNDGVAEDCFGRPCLFAEEQHCCCMPLLFNHFLLNIAVFCCLILRF